jgi:hypothetical protein
MFVQMGLPKAVAQQHDLPYANYIQHQSPITAATFRYLTRAISASLASLARWWYQRERAWWRRVHLSQWMTCGGGRGRVVRAARRRLISGDGQRDHAGVRWRRLVRPDRWRGLGDMSQSRWKPEPPVKAICAGLDMVRRRAYRARV